MTTLTETFDQTIQHADLDEVHATARLLARNLCVLADRAFERGDSTGFRELSKALLACLKELGATKTFNAVKSQSEGGAANDNPDPAAITFAALRASYN